MGNPQFTLCIAPDEGTDVGELMRLTGNAPLCPGLGN
jgi:hypothetical protein